MFGFVLNIVALVFILAFAIFGTLYTSGYLDKQLVKRGYAKLDPPTKWAIPNTVCYWICSVILFALLFI